MLKIPLSKSFLWLALTALSHPQAAPLTQEKSSQFETLENPSPLNEAEAQALLKIIADEHRFSHQIRQAAFETLREFSPKTEPHHLFYCEDEEIPLVKEVPASVYAQIIQSMSISCVDVFIYDFEKKAYLMVLRGNPPVQGLWWMPGGRIFKGESFYQCAVRKAKAECGLDVCTIAQLGTYSTYFPDSAWGTHVPTDTKNTVVLTLSNGQNMAYDQDHLGIKWVPIEEQPNDPYLLKAYQEATATLARLGFYLTNST